MSKMKQKQFRNLQTCMKIQIETIYKLNKNVICSYLVVSFYANKN